VMLSALPKSCGLFRATQQSSVGAGMELSIARQRRDKTCGRSNAAIYGVVAIAERHQRRRHEGAES
jgi:hypothetical protein